MPEWTLCPARKIGHEQHDFSDRFIAHMLSRNIRVEEDLVDQLFNSSEKRLARTLLLLARYGKEDTTLRTVPLLSQETLAEMIGTTRLRVNFFIVGRELLPARSTSSADRQNIAATLPLRWAICAVRLAALKARFTAPACQIVWCASPSR
jgi:hypothetical protein